MAARWPYQLVRDELASDLGLRERHEENAALDGPYRRINDFVLRNRLRSNISRRLEACTLVAASYGIDYRWPLLDARLVQQWLSTPSIEKANREHDRYLHRRAIDGVVVPKVAWSPVKEVGRPRLGGLSAPATIPAGIVDDARRQRAELHPIIDEVIDTRRLESQIAAAARAALNDDARFQFRRNVTHLSWLNRWLWDR